MGEKIIYFCDQCGKEVKDYFKIETPKEQLFFCDILCTEKYLNIYFKFTNNKKIIYLRTSNGHVNDCNINHFQVFAK